MKNIKIKYLFILTLGLLTSCKNYLDVNNDPTRSLVTAPELLLPASQLYIGNGLGDRMAAQMNVWCQYWTTGPGTSLGIWDRNNMNTSDGNQIYGQFYQRSLSNLYTLVTKTDEPVYQGIAKILMAYQLQYCVDLFGDIPYFEAFKGDIADGNITSPKFDDAKSVYAELIKLANEGIALISNPSPTAKKPGTDDVIYNGNLEKWLFFANSLKLKLYMRQINVSDDPTLQAEIKAQVETLEADGNLILSNSEIAKIKYGNAAPYANPMWNDYKSSIGLTYAASKTSIDALLTLDATDTRVNVFYNKNNSNAHVGLLHGDVENASSSASFSTPHGARMPDTAKGIIFDQEAPVLLITPWEVKFLLAEAAARGFNLSGGTDQEYYESAVKDNFAYFSLPISQANTYLVDGLYGVYNSSSLTTKIKSIAIQKWLSFNGTQSIESWIETRRLENASNPIFVASGGLFRTPSTNDLGGNIFPTILFYPATEESFNTNFPGQNQLTDKVFWDN